MARALSLRVAVPLAALLVLQWLAVLALARHTRADDAGTGLALVQAGLLLPVALAAVYAAVALVAGHRIGLVAAAFWALGPFAAAQLWDTRYRHLYEDGFLVRAAGLTHDSGFRAAVAVAVMLALTALALTRGRLWAGAAAGLAGSVAVWADPSAIMALGVPFLVLVAARRPTLAAAALAGAVPGMVVLAGDTLPTLPTTNARWSHLNQNELSFQEYFWSMRVLQWLPLAGAIGLARRSWPLALGLLAVVAGWLIVEGSSVGAQVFDGTFVALLLPAAPAFCALAAGIVLLVPPLRVREHVAVDGLDAGSR